MLCYLHLKNKNYILAILTKDSKKSPASTSGR
nr:MAG TPA: hypothetical protein [Caudoviricetes sp.]